MTRWKSYRGAAQLRIEAGAVRLVAEGADMRFSFDDVRRGDRDVENIVREAFDFEVWVELRALAEYAALLDGVDGVEGVRAPVRQEIAPSVSVPRRFGRGGRGYAGPMAFIMGREVWVNLSGQPQIRSDLARVAEVGVPPVARVGLGDELSDRVEEAARTLTAAPCSCSTGCKEASQHTELRYLHSRQHPQAPTEHRVTVGFCQACGRFWRFVKAGDAHYSFRCRADELQVDLGAFSRDA